MGTKSTNMNPSARRLGRWGKSGGQTKELEISREGDAPPIAHCCEAQNFGRISHRILACQGNRFQKGWHPVGLRNHPLLRTRHERVSEKCRFRLPVRTGVPRSLFIISIACARARRKPGSAQRPAGGRTSYPICLGPEFSIGFISR